MSKKVFELATAYVAVMPSLEGVEGQLAKEVSKALPGMDRVLSTGLSDSFKNAGSLGSKGLVGSLLNGVDAVGGKIFSSIGGAFSKAGSLLSSTLSTGINASLATVGVGVAAVVGKVATGGLTRALGLNEAQARLSALGYTAEEVSGIMDAAGNAIDGTAYAMNESVGTAAQLLSAGVKDTGLLEKSLSNVAKLSDISGSSFADMGNIFAKAAAKGKVQYEDLVQLMNHQIPIMSELAKSMGVPVEEVQKLASAGEISFQDFQKAVEQIEFDSVIYATKNVGMAWKNVLSQLSKTGEIFWAPIIDGLGPALGVVRQGIIDIRDNPAMKTILDGAVAGIKDRVDSANNYIANLGSKMSSEDFVGRKIDEWIKIVERFKNSISGAEGVIGGLGLALSSGFLSKLPVVGSLFGGITVGVGALGGALFQAYKDSENLQNSISTMFNVIKIHAGRLNFGEIFDFGKIGDALGNVVYSITNAINSIAINLKLDGFSLTPLIEFILGQFTYLIDQIAQNGPEIGAVISQIGKVFSDAFSSLEGADGSMVKGLVDNIVKALELLPPLLELTLQIGAGFMDVFMTVASSDLANSIVGFIVEALQWIADSGMGPLIGGAIAILYSSMKIFPILKTIGGFIPTLAGVFSGAAGTGKIIGGGLSSIITAVASAGQAAISGITAVAAIGAIILGIGGLIWLLDKMNTFDILRDIALNVIQIFETSISVLLTAVGTVIELIVQAVTGIASNIESLWTAIEPILQSIVTGVQTFFETIGTIFSNVIETIVNSLATIIEAISEAFSITLESTGAFIQVLAQDGLAAGAGALATATGIAALAGALLLLTGSNLLESIGNFAAGAVDGLASLFGFDSSGVGGLLEAAETLNTFNETVQSMPATWAAVGAEAYGAGVRIIEGFTEGLLAGLQTAEQAAIAQITAMLSRMQAQVSSTPINLNVSGGVSMGSSSSINTTNNNYNISTSNNSIARSLIGAARGARRY